MKNKRKPLFVLAIIITILFFINPKTINFIKVKAGLGEENISKITEIETPHSSQIVYEKLGNGLLQYWEGVLIYYNMNGKQVWSINLGIKRPVIKANANSVYIIDESKNQMICINKDGKEKYKAALDKSYKNFNICNDNYVAVYHNTDSPVQYISIINEEGKKTGEITLGEVEVTNLEISKIDEKIALSTIGINKDALENNISIYDLNGNLIGVENLKNNIILNIFYNEKGDLIAVDEKNIFNINQDNKVANESNFNELIKKMDITDKDYMILYSEGSKKNSIIYSPSENKIKTVGHNGKLIAEVKNKEDILGMDHYKNHVLAYSLRTIFKYNKNGSVKIEYPYPSDILKSFILSENNIAVITKEKVTFLSISQL